MPKQNRKSDPSEETLFSPNVAPRWLIMLRRILDALYLLFMGQTRTESRCRVLELDLLTMMEKLNAWAARQARRDSRELARNLDEQLGLSLPTPTGDRKSQLRRRAFEARAPHLAPMVAPTSPLPLPTMNEEPEHESTDEIRPGRKARAHGAAQSG